MNSQVGWETLPVGKAPKPLPVAHFPDALHAVVWRNWDVIPLERMAEVLKASPEAIRELAFSMGLREQRSISLVEVRRNYMTILHRNWHLLPYEQLGAFLGWSPARMQFGLNEDDFMWSKLGGYKPDCPPVYYQPPNSKDHARALEIADVLANDLGSEWEAPAEPPFGFIRRFRKMPSDPLESSLEIRMVYPYFLRYGDPLLGEGVDDIPEGYLAELAGSGVNAIWLQGILNTLVHWDLAPELSRGREERLTNLRKLVDRAGIFGIKVFLYLNEPRAMPRAFFERHPELRGVEEMPSRALYAPDVVAMCLSTQPVKDFIVNSVRHVFEQVPGLGGILSLTYSENLTNCYSRTYLQKAPDGNGLHHAYDPTSTNPRNREQPPCPRCFEHGPEAINAEVCSLLAQGMRQAGSDGKLLLYLWSTPEEWIPGILERLPAGSWVLCVSEWGTPFVRGDYHGTVNEYSISVVGPSDQSRRQWGLARAHKVRAAAKMQAANTYEFSSIPYIPALRLVAQHLANLAAVGVEGLMLGWTAGGSPSPNLDLVGEFAKNPSIGAEEAMLAVAQRRFGEEAAHEVIEAWNVFSDAYEEFPFDINVCYAGPQSLGPANLLYAKPSGFRATMVTFPFDDLDGWRGPYSAETLQSQFEKVANGWSAGVEMLQRLRQEKPSEALDDEWRVAATAGIHFKSTINQIRYIRVREKDPELAAQILEDEIALTRTLFALVRADSRLGFEATNHYGYIRFDLAEKIINCRHLLSLT